MKKNIIGFGLLVFAAGSIVPMTIINRHYVAEKNGSTYGYWQSTAKNIDIWANKEFRATWNAKLIIPSGYKFGIEGETISSALGKNELMGTLTKEGKILVKMLNKLEKNHCILWINTEVGDWIDPRKL